MPVLACHVDDKSEEKSPSSVMPGCIVTRCHITSQYTALSSCDGHWAVIIRYGTVSAAAAKQKPEGAPTARRRVFSSPHIPAAVIYRQHWAPHSNPITSAAFNSPFTRFVYSSRRALDLMSKALHLYIFRLRIQYISSYFRPFLCAAFVAFIRSLAPSQLSQAALTDQPERTR